jgi:DNA-binding NarL/FixJ family response regulator
MQTEASRRLRGLSYGGRISGPTASHDGTSIRVVVADDSYLIREAIQQVLERCDGVEVVAVCEDGDELRRTVAREAPHVVVTDARMPPRGDDEGIRVAAELRETRPDVGVVVLSQYADPQLGLELLADGADGRAYLLKSRVHDEQELQTAIEVVARGGSMIHPEMVQMLLDAEERRRSAPLADLTPREREVLAEMAEGKSNAAIADSLVLTKRAVEKHVGAIFAKLGLEGDEIVSRRVVAVLRYLADVRD